MSQKAYRIRLECEHELWLKKPLPRNGELLFCTKCDTYVNVGPGSVRNASTYWPDYDWRSTPLKPNGYRGECLVPDCDHEETVKWDFYELRNKMVSHHLHQHTISSLIARAFVVPVPTESTLDTPPF